MKITNLQNSRTFNGLNLAKVSSQDMKRVIEPCIKGLRKVAQKADIRLESSVVLKEFEHYKTPVPVINISIAPLAKVKSQVAAINYSMFLDDIISPKRSVLKIIKNAIEML